MTVSGVHAASCLAARRKSRRATSTDCGTRRVREVGLDKGVGGGRVVIIDTGCLDAGSIDASILRYRVREVMRRGVTSSRAPYGERPSKFRSLNLKDKNEKKKKKNAITAGRS